MTRLRTLLTGAVVVVGALALATPTAGGGPATTAELVQSVATTHQAALDARRLAGDPLVAVAGGALGLGAGFVGGGVVAYSRRGLR
ncbi:MAG: hypothetical protein ABEJ79_06475 [Halolamina sp.]